MQILKFFALLLFVPKPPIICIDNPEVDSFLCPGQDVHRYFMQREGCNEPVFLFSACGVPPAEDPDNFLPPPPVDPDFDEFSPTGPGEGPPGAPPVDKPDV